MKNNSVFIAKYIISEYDGEVNTHPFSTLNNAMDYCKESDEEFVEDSLNNFHGWLIEEHTIDNPQATIKYYNSQGKELCFNNTVCKRI